MTLTRLSLAAIAAVGCVVTANAQTLSGNLLLRQTAGTGVGYVNQNFSDFPTFSAGMGSLVTVSGPAWNINDIQLAYAGAAGNTITTGVTTALLSVSRQTAGAPDVGHDPTTAQATSSLIVYSGNVNITFDQIVGLNFRGIANTASITQLQGLAAGNYVFSLVLNTSFATNGQAFTQTTGATTQNGYVRNTGGGFALPSGTAWGTLATNFAANGATNNTDWAIGINGTTVPEPASMAALGLGALAMIRRRRNKKA